MTKRKVALITDSTCDIPQDWREKYDIDVVPLTIILGDRQYKDGIDLTAEQFYELLPHLKSFPSTSQPSPQDFLLAFQNAADKGYEEALVIVISSAMSGTINSTREAAAESPIPVHVLDGKNNSMGLGWQVIAAARTRDAGGDAAAMIKTAEQVRDHMAYYITLDTMEYLSKGGRIGSATKFLESIIKIKPLISVNPKTGSVIPSIPARSRHNAIEGMVREFSNHVDAHYPIHVAVLHNAGLEEAQALAERVQRELSPQEIIISITSPILGSHTGPKALALCGYSISES
ncbi:MAG TPA: DegV family protein [Longilinea sp.]|nr:DegV family protein [Longilinea sp.]